MTETITTRVCFVVAFALLIGPFGAAAGASDKASSTRIKNFGRVSNGLYRGAQPTGSDYQTLANLGIKTVVDLQREGEKDEPGLVEAAGMKFHRIAMSDSAEPSRNQIDEFLGLVAKPENQPVFVHCRGGRHRTGAMIAIYRLVVDRWDADKAYQEMKNYDFGKGFGHGAMKDCVYGYYQNVCQTATNSSKTN